MAIKLGNKIERVINTDLEGFKVKLRLIGGKTIVVSLDHIFGSPKNLAKEVLKGGAFAKCFVESGALAWPNGLELCADAICEWHREQSKVKSLRKAI